MAGPSRYYMSEDGDLGISLADEQNNAELLKKVHDSTKFHRQAGASSARDTARQLPQRTYRSSDDNAQFPDFVDDAEYPGPDRHVSQKDEVDWYQESQGRRVGYDDLTAIDWIFEYAKERQRLRKLLAGSQGLPGLIKQIADASHVWIVLVLSGVATGLVAAMINISSTWLGDVKTGFCRNGEGGGQFYLSRQFCCWGHDSLAQCQDWTPWRAALGLSSIGAGYIVEYIFFVLFAVLFASSAAILVMQYSTFARQSGIPEIKTVLGGFVIRRFLGGWTLLIKSIGLCLSVSSGLWLGHEGPLVHVACCCANLLMQPFSSLNKNEARKREILSAAAASGIGVAFGAPIGGVLFSLEQLSYFFPDRTMWQSFVCAMVAAVTLQALNPFHTGKIVLYQVTYSSGWHSFEMVPFVLLGIIGGVFGGVFTRLNMLVVQFRKSDHNPLQHKPLLEVVLVSTLTALINFPNNFMRAQLSELVEYLFAECATIGNKDVFGLCRVTTAGSLSMVTLLVTAAALGSMLAIITFGLPIPAGVMLPSLAIGALYGRAMGVIMELFHKHFGTSIVFAACEPDIPCITPGTYAIVGAAASLAGVTRLTASIVVIMFELTGALTYVLPIMIAVMLSKWVADAISEKGIYEAWIHYNEYPNLDNKDDSTKIPHVPVSNIMTAVSEMTCIDASRDCNISELQTMLEETPFKGYPIITTNDTPSKINDGTDNQVLVGYISRTELTYALEKASTTRNAALSADEDARANVKCYFRHRSVDIEGPGLDLRPWTNQTPITLNANSTFQVAVSMFQSMGLRYLLLVNRGCLCGILTKKDVWWILNASETARKTNAFVPGAGALREQEDEGEADHDAGEDRGLLHERGAHG